MKYLKFLAVLLLPIFLISWLSAQDLTEAAKKEKARRDEAKAKKVSVITNADLQSLKKRAAVGSTETQEPKTEGEAGQAEAGAPANPEGSGSQAMDNSDSGGSAAPETMPIGTPMPTKLDDSQRMTLESNYAKAKEYADLLETKINGLWQAFYSMDDMTPKDQIQQQISDTFDKYQKARDDESKAKDELDRYLATIKKD